MVEHLTTLLDRAKVVPAVNQIECHPYFQQPEVQQFGAEHGILTQAWSPIGGITFYREGSHGSTLEDPAIKDIATAHGKTPAQVMLRWGLQHGRSVIPKSIKPSRIAENIDVFDFELSADEMAAIDGLDTGRRGGPDPDAVTLEAFGRDIPEGYEPTPRTCPARHLLTFGATMNVHARTSPSGLRESDRVPDEGQPDGSRSLVRYTTLDELVREPGRCGWRRLGRAAGRRPRPAPPRRRSARHLRRPRRSCRSRVRTVARSLAEISW